MEFGSAPPRIGKTTQSPGIIESRRGQKQTRKKARPAAKVRNVGI